MAYYMRNSGGGPKAETRRRVEVIYQTHQYDSYTTLDLTVSGSIILEIFSSPIFECTNRQKL